MNRKKINIRRRVVFATLICSFLFFLFNSPFVDFISDFLSFPAQIEKVTVLKESNNLRVSWESSKDVRSFIFKANGENLSLDASVNETSVEISKFIASGNYLIGVSYIDNLGRESVPVQVNAESLISNTTGQELIVVENFLNNQGLQARGGYIFLTSLVISIVGGLLLSWIFLRDFSNNRTWFLIFYFIFLLFAFLNLSLTFLLGQEVVTNRYLILIISTPIFYIVTYLLYLTVNILQNSLHYDLPLEQAAKASQFIFSLIGGYFVIFSVMSASRSIMEKIGISGVFIGVFTLASIAMNKKLEIKEALFKTAMIAATIIFSIFVLSLWPINYIYIVLAIAVIYYILLSVALEVRTTVPKYSYYEYLILTFLIILLLFLGSEWGIRGSLI